MGWLPGTQVYREITPFGWLAGWLVWLACLVSLRVGRNCEWRQLYPRRLGAVGNGYPLRIRRSEETKTNFNAKERPPGKNGSKLL